MNIKQLKYENLFWKKQYEKDMKFCLSVFCFLTMDNHISGNASSRSKCWQGRNPSLCPANSVSQNH